jgi:hydrogenase maturation protease
MAKKMGMEINTVVIGIEPKVLDWGMELSEEVKKKIPTIIEAVLKEC